MADRRRKPFTQVGSELINALAFAGAVILYNLPHFVDGICASNVNQEVPNVKDHLNHDLKSYSH